MLDDKDDFEPLITLEGVRNLISHYKEQEKQLIELNAQRSGTEMILNRLLELERILERR